MARKKKRAPGGGRKPLDPDKALSDPVKVRLPPGVREGLEKLADKHGLDLSGEARVALKSWVMRHKQHAAHIEALACMVAFLAGEIERSTKKRWIQDPMTGAAVREGVERLTSHFAPTPDGPVTVPADIGAIAGMVITMIEHAAPRSDASFKKGLGSGWYDDGELAGILRDLGSGWIRNQAQRRKKP